MKKFYVFLLCLLTIQIIVSKDIFVRQQNVSALEKYFMRLKRGLHCFVSKKEHCTAQKKRAVFSAAALIVAGTMIYVIKNKHGQALINFLRYKDPRFRYKTSKYETFW